MAAESSDGLPFKGLEFILFVFRNNSKKQLASPPARCYFPAIERAGTDLEMAEFGSFPWMSSAENPCGNAIRRS